jgi:hypothetical protein
MVQKIIIEIQWNMEIVSLPSRCAHPWLWSGFRLHQGLINADETANVIAWNVYDGLDDVTTHHQDSPLHGLFVQTSLLSGKIS